MTLSRLALVLFIALAIIDYVFNNGRLVEALGESATQFGNWLNDSLMSLLSNFAPSH